MVSLGEMATFIPVSGAFTAYANRFVDPSLAFAMGWTYWLSCEELHPLAKAIQVLLCITEMNV